MKNEKEINGVKILRVEEERGIFNNIPIERFKRVYVIRNHQLNTVRAYHFHPEEEILLYSLKGAWKVCTYPINHTAEPNKVVIGEGEGVYVPANYGNGHMNLTENAVLLCCATLSLSEVIEEEIKVPWDKFGGHEWKTKKR